MSEAMRAKGWARAFPVETGVGAGRRWARERLAMLEWTEDAPETVDAILLVVTELVTNTHLHAHTRAHVVISWDGHCLHVHVCDDDPTLPTPRTPDTLTPGGRGLALVDAVTDDWNIHPHRHGKTIDTCFRPPTPGESTTP
ncbi:ATP-binding protein [Embleya sp. NBC_00888]|uniref:ATP-binding protein n=1 Tax=Embleya sp. NBC_00888 TaxID=2975960 RepID=UPI002F917E2F